MQVIALMLLSELPVRFPIKQRKIYLRLPGTCCCSALFEDKKIPPAHPMFSQIGNGAESGDSESDI
ncbi:MAG: hypothetical protein BWK80_00730 [Desulfobacteraceae bacterium IS3]|nr:MAG: hypothetical protein BWK80_00730 [Desulfobacteraceae bacterium IS3]